MMDIGSKASFMVKVFNISRMVKFTKENLNKTNLMVKAYYENVMRQSMGFGLIIN